MKLLIFILFLLGGNALHARCTILSPDICTPSETVHEKIRDRY